MYDVTILHTTFRFISFSHVTVYLWAYTCVSDFTFFFHNVLNTCDRKDSQGLLQTYCLTAQFSLCTETPAFCFAYYLTFIRIPFNSLRLLLLVLAIFHNLSAHKNLCFKLFLCARNHKWCAHGWIKSDTFKRFVCIRTNGTNVYEKMMKTKGKNTTINQHISLQSRD